MILYDFTLLNIKFPLCGFAAIKRRPRVGKLEALLRKAAERTAPQLLLAKFIFSLKISQSLAMAHNVTAG